MIFARRKSMLYLKYEDDNTRPVWEVFSEPEFVLVGAPSEEDIKPKDPCPHFSPIKDACEW